MRARRVKWRRWKMSKMRLMWSRLLRASMKKASRKLTLTHKYRTSTKVIRPNYQVYLVKARVIIVK